MHDDQHAPHRGSPRNRPQQPPQRPAPPGPQGQRPAPPGQRPAPPGPRPAEQPPPGSRQPPPRPPRPQQPPQQAPRRQPQQQHRQAPQGGETLDRRPPQPPPPRRPHPQDRRPQDRPQQDRPRREVVQMPPPTGLESGPQDQPRSSPSPRQRERPIAAALAGSTKARASSPAREWRNAETQQIPAVEPETAASKQVKVRFDEEEKPATRLREKRVRLDRRSVQLTKLTVGLLAILVFVATGGAWGMKIGTTRSSRKSLRSTSTQPTSRTRLPSSVTRTSSSSGPTPGRVRHRKCPA